MFTKYEKKKWIKYNEKVLRRMLKDIPGTSINIVNSLPLTNLKKKSRSLLYIPLEENILAYKIIDTDKHDGMGSDRPWSIGSIDTLIEAMNLE